MTVYGHFLIRPGLRLTGLNCLAVEAEGTLVQADQGSLAGLGQKVQVASLEFADSGVIQTECLETVVPANPEDLGQVVQTESLEFADRVRLAALGALRLKEIERPTRCTFPSLRSGPRPLETDAA